MRRFGSTCLSCLFLMCAATLPALAQVAPIGAPFEIASAAGTHTSPPLLAARPDGTYLIAWTTQLPSGEVMYGRLLGPSGAPIGPQLLLAAGPVSDPSVAVTADGGFVMAWEQGGEILVSAFDRDGRVRIPAFAAAPKDPTLLPAKPDVAVGSDGGWMVAWLETQTPVNNFYQRISGRWFEADGTPRTAPAPLGDPALDELSRPELAALPDGGYLAVWAIDYIPVIEPIGNTSYFLTRRFDAAGAPVAPEKSLPWGGADPRLVPLPGNGGFVLVEQALRGSPTIEDTQRLDIDGEGLPRSLTFGAPFSDHLSIAIDSAGRLLLVGSDRLNRRVSARLFDADSLAPLVAPFELATAKPPLGQPFLASASPGQFLLVWEDQNRWMGEIHVVGCGEPQLGLCLAQNRFRVEVSWTDHQGNTGTGHAVPLKDDTGSFWFFTPSNVELLVKILDGRSINHHFWVFYGSLSDVEYDIRVTDTQTGDVQTYHNPEGTLASRADVQAFPPDPGTDPPSSTPGAARSGGIRSTVAPLTPPIFCHSSATALCLDPLYRVSIDFVDPQTGATRHAQAAPFSDESGAFWFFDKNNLELFVKVLDGSAVNGHTWVFYGGLTDVEYTLKVEDLAGATWTYHNPRGRMSSGADTSALPPPVHF